MFAKPIFKIVYASTFFDRDPKHEHDELVSNHWRYHTSDAALGAESAHWAALGVVGPV